MRSLRGLISRSVQFALSVLSSSDRFGKIVAATVTTMLVLSALAGTSSALGGPDVIRPAAHIASSVANAPKAAQPGANHANPNAFEGRNNAGQGIGNASQTGQQNANPNAGA